MIKIPHAIIVEGRYDKIKLDSVADTIIVTTDGFNIFKDKEKQQLIKMLARDVGIVILTDSDDAGFKIRKFLKDIAAQGQVFDAYIPEMHGKEKRKSVGGRAGLVGVEGIDSDIIKKALGDCITANELHVPVSDPDIKKVTANDLFEDGLNGCEGAAMRRAEFLKFAGLPTRLSTKALIDIMTRLYGHDRYTALVAEFYKNSDARPRKLR